MLRDSLPEDLQPHEPRLGDIVRQGLALFLARFGDKRGTMSTRTVRSSIHDCMVEIAKKLYPGQFSENPFLVRIGPYRIKPKKFNRRLETANNPTQRVLDFLCQKMRGVYDLFGSKEVINLHVGYVPNDMSLMDSTVWVTCPSGLGTNEWVYEIPAQAGQAYPPTPVTVPEVPGPAPRVRPKPSELPGVEEAKN